MAYQPLENYVLVLIVQDGIFSISIQHHTVPGIAATHIASDIRIPSVEKLERFLNALGVDAIQKQTGAAGHSNLFEVVPCTVTEYINWLTDEKNHHSPTSALIVRNMS